MAHIFCCFCMPGKFCIIATYCGFCFTGCWIFLCPVCEHCYEGIVVGNNLVLSGFAFRKGRTRNSQAICSPPWGPKTLLCTLRSSPWIWSGWWEWEICELKGTLIFSGHSFTPAFRQFPTTCYSDLTPEGNTWQELLKISGSPLLSILCSVNCSHTWSPPNTLHYPPQLWPTCSAWVSSPCTGLELSQGSKLGSHKAHLFVSHLSAVSAFLAWCPYVQNCFNTFWLCVEVLLHLRRHTQAFS